MKNKQVIKFNKDFETITLRLVFPFEEKEEDIAKNCLLPNMLKYMCEKYNTEESYSKAKLEKYILNLSSNSASLTTTGFFSFTLTIPDSKLLTNQEIKEAIALLYEVVYKPKVINNGFDEFELNREINNIKTSIENSKKNLRGYMSHRIPNLIDNVGIYKRSIDNYLEQFVDITPQNLFEHYKEIIQSKSPHCFIFGNVDKKFITKTLEEYFSGKEIVEFSPNFNYFLKPFRNKAQVILEEKDFKQSGVCVVFKIKDYCLKDKTALSLIKGLLMNSSSNLLFNKLRLEEKLVYSASATYSGRYGIFKISAFVDKEKLEYTKDKIIELMNSLNDEKKINKLLNAINEDFKISMIEDKDNYSYLMDEIMDKYFNIEDTQEEIYQKRIKCKAKDIIKLINRFEVDTILYVKEKNNE